MFMDSIDFIFIVVDDYDQEDLEFVNKFDALEIKKKLVKTKIL